MLLRLLSAVPGVVALESPIEVEHADKILASVLRLTQQKPEIDESEDDVADVGSGGDSPVLENNARHQTVTLEREIPAAVKRMIIVLQPLLIAFIGFVILMVALAIILPILNIYNSIGVRR